MSNPYYIVDSNNIAIRKVDETGVISTLVLTSSDTTYLSHLSDNQFSNPSAPSGFLEPWGMGADTDGNFFVCDFGTSNVYKITPAGVVTLVAGSDISGQSGDGGPATAARVRTPWYIAVDAVGNFYFSDFGSSSHRIRAVNTQPTTQVLMGISIPAGCIDTVAGTGSIGSTGDGGPAIAAMLAGPIGVAITPNGDLLICDQNNNCIRKVDNNTGIISVVAGTNTNVGDFSGDGGLATAAGLNTPIGISVDTDGNLFINDTGNQRIRVVNMQAGPITICGQVIAAGNIQTIAGNGTQGFSGDGGPGPAAELNNVWSARRDPASGDVFLVGEDYRIRVINDSTGNILTVVGNGTNGYTGDGGPATAAKISFVFDLIFLPSAPLPPVPSIRGSGCDAPRNKNAFLLIEKTPQSNQTYQMKAVNYDDAYYDHDGDFDLTGTGGFVTGGEGDDGSGLGFGTAFGIFGG